MTKAKPEQKQPPRDGWECLKSAVRWRFCEPEFKAVVAALLSDLDVEQAVDLVLAARYAETGSGEDRDVAVESVLAGQLLAVLPQPRGGER